MDALDTLCLAMTEYYAGEPKQIQHLLKVHAFARMIGLGEGLDAKAPFTLEAAAYVHDIGIKPAMEKYASSAGPLQEKEGGPAARKVLSGLGFASDVTERAVFLVEHHLTYTGVDGSDWQILLEADYLVNSYEGNADAEAVRAAMKRFFRTEAGTRLLKTQYPYLNDQPGGINE